MKPDEDSPREGEPIPRELSLREIRFSKFYAELAIGSRAYELAGYPDCANPSAKAAKLLRKPRIKAYIKEIRDRAKAQADVDPGFVLLALKNIVSADRRLLYNEDGSLKPVHEWPAHVAETIESIETTESALGAHTKKIKIGSRLQALSMMAKLMGMLDKKEEKAEQTEEKYVIELPAKEPIQAPAAS